MGTLSDLFITQFDFHWTRQPRPRLEGLTDEENFHEPVPNAWNVRRKDNGRVPVRGSGPSTSSSPSRCRRRSPPSHGGWSTS